MNVISMLLIAIRLVGSLGLTGYVLLLSHIPLLVWVADGGVTLGFWLGLALLVVCGGWWVIWHKTRVVGWVWLAGFALLHAMLYFSPAVWGPWAQDSCLDRGGQWQPPLCITKP
jgi:hypothetical protein